MRRAPAWVVAVGVLVGCAAAPATATAGVWVTLAAGVPGTAAPTSSAEFWFDSPHGPPAVAVNELTGAAAQAVTGGGNTYFGGVGTPVLLNLADGSAYVAGGGPPDAATARGPSNGTTAPPASAAPTAGGAVPAGAALLGVNVAEPDAAGARTLTATATDAAGTQLGTGSLTVPDGGWWVLGLTPGAGPPSPVVDPPPVIDPPVVDPPVVVTPPPTPVPGTGGGTVATPEPTTLAMAAIGGPAVWAWRRLRSRAKAM